MTNAQRAGGRDELSRSLRALRERAGLSQVEASKRSGIGQRKVSRFENSLYIPDLAELEALLRCYESPEETATQLRARAQALLAEPRKPRVVIPRANVATIQHRIGMVERKARRIEAFQPTTVIGLIQSASYVRTLFGQDDIADAEDAIAARLARQRQVADSGQELTFIQSEGSLRWQLGSPTVMIEQLELIARMATAAPNLRVGIIPWHKPVSRTVVNGFRLYDRAALNIGSEAGDTLLQGDDDVQEACALFDLLTEWADFGDAAAEHANRIAYDYRRL